MNRITANPHLLPAGLEMSRWLKEWTDKLTPPDWAALLDPLAVDLIRTAVAEAAGTEGSLWIRDEVQAALVPVFNTGPHAREFVLTFAQPLNHGIIAMVHANQMSIIEDDVARSSLQDPALDRLLAVKTQSLLAVPFQFFGTSIGVLSSVILAAPGEAKGGVPATFAPEAIRVFERTAETLQRILEWEFLRVGLGMADS